jgi:hypothetical protein
VIPAPSPIPLDPRQPPILLVVVDVEEEFDWSAQPDRGAVSVRAVHHLHQADSIFADYGIVPTYVVDYPVASRRDACVPLLELRDAGRAVIGAHLHPWVNPPHTEPLSRSNMYPGNLGRELESAKLSALVDRIGESFGQRPVVYKAGRYGIGPNSAEILEALGFEVDVSVSPPIDHGEDGGPDFSRAPCEPYWFGRRRRMLEIPLTGAYVGWAGSASPGLYRLATRPALARLRLPGILSRARVVDRLMLSPEGFTTREHIRLTRRLLRRGVRTFTWSFHSSSLVVGGSPYSGSAAELDRFLAAFRRYFDFFFGVLKGTTLTTLELKRRLESAG